MQITRKAPKRKPIRTSPGAGKSASSGIRGKSKRTRSLVSRKRKNSTTRRDNKPAALIDVSMKGIAGPQVDLNTKPKGLCIIDTETKMLKAMGDLLPLVEKLIGFEENISWDINSTVAEVFHHFYRTVLIQKTVCEAQIVQENRSYKLRITIPIYLNERCSCMPVYFISALENRHKTLFELSFYLVALIHRQSRVDTWQEDNDSYIFDGIQSELADYKTHRSDGNYEKEIAALEEAYENYKEKGPATKFCERLEKTGASKKLWLKAFNEFTPKTAMEKSFYQWFKLGRDLLSQEESIHKFISLPSEYDPEQYESIPLTPDQVVKFLWRVDDWWWGSFEGMNDSVEQNDGSVPFYNITTISSFPELAKAYDCFPKKLLEFMSVGRRLEEKYRSSFCDEKKLKKALTPKPIPLIDILL